MKSLQKMEISRVARKFTAKKVDAVPPPPAQALLKVSQTLATGLSVPPLCRSVRGPSLLELTEEGIENWLNEIDRLNHEQGKHIVKTLTNGCRKDWSQWITLFYGSAGIFVPAKKIEFDITWQTHWESLFNTLAQVCIDFGAFYGCTWDYSLSTLHGRAERRYQLRLAKTPPEHHDRIPHPKPEVVDVLPPLLNREEFDQIRVPDGVWWINFWSSTQLETIGVERVRHAGWSRIIERPEGFLLVATDEPTTVFNPSHLQKLSDIVTYLNLRECQEEHRISRLDNR